MTARTRRPPVPTFSDALSCAGGPAPGSSGGGGARRFFTSDLSDAPEMLLSDRDGPNLTEREFTDGEFGVVKQPCRGGERQDVKGVTNLRRLPCVPTRRPAPHVASWPPGGLRSSRPPPGQIGQ